MSTEVTKATNSSKVKKNSRMNANAKEVKNKWCDQYWMGWRFFEEQEAVHEYEIEAYAFFYLFSLQKLSDEIIWNELC